MPYEVQEINEGQYLKDIWKLIPTDAVIHKTLPGLGATTLEIECERHSIIIEPYVPVIEGKQVKHPNVLGVRSGINKEHIKQYLKRKDITYKKIIATPEAWDKIVGAFNDLKIDFKKEFFLLIDECEKLIQDADFRPSITKPLADFWDFEGKAMISATTIPSHEKKLRAFRNIYLKPTFDYSIQHILYLTNNINAAIRDVVDDMKSHENCFCFFINSADAIVSIIKMLDIEAESKVFGSDTVVAKLKRMDYNNAYSSVGPLARFNFFTAKFFSAVDIDEDRKPIVIAVTDAYLSDYTMLDPDTEMVQLMGRFRKGISFGMHITNIRRDLPIRTEQEVKEIIKGRFKAYQVLRHHFNQERDPNVKIAFKEAMDSLKFSEYLYTIRGKLAVNHFVIDNEIADERVKSYYQNAALLEQCYAGNPFYNLITRNKDFEFEKGDRTSRSNSTLKELRKEIVDALDEMEFNGGGTLLEHFSQGELNLDKGFIIDAYHKLGKAKIEELNFSTSKINIALTQYNSDHNIDKNPVKTMMLNLFQVKTGYWESEIRSNMETVNKTLGLGLKPTISTLKSYFTLSSRTTITKHGKSAKGYRIEGLSEFI